MNRDPFQPPSLTPSQDSQHIEMPPAFIVGDKLHERADTGSTSSLSRNIEFDPVAIVGTRPQVIEMTPLEIVVPKPDSSVKESGAAQAPRATLSAPSSEPKQQSVQNLEVSPTPDDKAIAEKARKETPVSDSDFLKRRQNWADGPFSDYTAFGVWPSIVYPNKPESDVKPSPTSPRRKPKPKQRKKDEVKPIPISVPTATQTEPKKEESPKELTSELARQIVGKVLSDPEFNIRMNRARREKSDFIPEYLQGTWRNLKYYLDDMREQLDPNLETNAHTDDCNGLSIVAYGELKKMNLLGVTFDTAERKGFLGADHTAIKVTVGFRAYVIDWHQKLEAENPVIHNYDNWISGKDSLGVTYKEFISGKSLSN